MACISNLKGQVQLTDLNPPHSYVISGSGTGGKVGATGSAHVTLEEIENERKPVYEVDAAVTGKIAQLDHGPQHSQKAAGAFRQFCVFAYPTR